MSEYREKPDQVPAIAISLQVSCGTTSTVVLQTHVAQDALEGEIQAVLDRLDRAAQRLADHERVRDISIKLDGKMKEIEFTSDQFARAEVTYELDKKRRETDSEQAAKTDERLWENSGRRGEYAPGQAYKSRLAALMKEQTNSDEERARALASYEVTQATLKRQMDEWSAQLLELRRSLNGADSHANH